jgi:hypothetical protein
MANAAYVWSGSAWVAVASAIPQTHQRGITYVSDTAYTLGVNDIGKCILFSSNSAVTVTIPSDSVYSFSVGQTLELVQMGSGTVTVQSGGDPDLRYRLGFATSGQYSKIELMKINSDEWLLSGDLD